MGGGRAVRGWAWASAGTLLLGIIAAATVLVLSVDGPSMGRLVPMAAAGLGVGAAGLGVALPGAAAVAIALDVALPGGPSRDALAAALRSLQSLPPVVHGVLGVVVLVPILGASATPLIGLLVVGGALLAPLTEDLRRALGRAQREERIAAAALGATPLQTLVYAILPAARRHILAAVIRGLGVALGLAAPILVLGELAGDPLPAAVARAAVAGDLGVAAAGAGVLAVVGGGLWALAWTLDRPRVWRVRW